MNEAQPRWTLQDAETAATGTILKIGRLRRFMIPVLDALFFPWVYLTDFLRKPLLRKEDDEIRKILVIQYANLGDIVLLLPFLRNLRMLYPRAQITLLAQSQAMVLLRGQDLVDEFIPVRVPLGMYSSRWRRWNPFSALWFRFWRCLRRLREREYDLAFAGEADIFQNLFLWVTRAARRVGYGFRGGRYFLTDLAMPDVSNPHVANCWLALLQPLGKPVLERQPRLKILPEEQRLAAEFLEGNGVRNCELIIGIHAGSRTPVRQWGHERFCAVADRVARRFKVKILWFQDPNAGNQASEAPPGSITVALDLRGFMAVLACCQLLICNDSGPMHIASALGVPVVSIFGPTEPSWYGPLGADHRIIIRRGFWCRPCAEFCIFDEPYCLRTISVEEVFGVTAEAILSVSGGRLDEVEEAPVGRLALNNAPGVAHQGQS